MQAEAAAQSDYCQAFDDTGLEHKVRCFLLGTLAVSFSPSTIYQKEIPR
ncbi:MAG: hypothetical protein HJJLKODD_02998 [Phycisphaerae bacterium]|nr:hypothetical protein [Phycisphaerae bacterium]